MEKGLLGDDTPQHLLDTIIFYSSTYIVIRNIGNCKVSHAKLRWWNDLEREYAEDISKNRPGGLKGRNTTPKVVKHHANKDNPQQCFVQKVSITLPTQQSQQCLVLTTIKLTIINLLVLKEAPWPQHSCQNSV